jgi:drug/metabolite transporter (DMT)-like permease
MTRNVGEIAALITAMCFSASSIFFTLAGNKFGPLISNRLRLLVAVILLWITHWIFFGSLIPLNAELQKWFWLGSSGIVGLAIGDYFLFKAFVSIGPRLGLLFLSLSPAIATMLAWIFLQETIDAVSIFAILLTLIGIAWVVLESKPDVKTSNDHPSSQPREVYIKGLIAGLIAATGQALGMILAKKGLSEDFPALSGNVIRMTAAFIALWAVTIIQGQVLSTVQQAGNHKSAMVYILIGSFFGPLIGVSLSLFAIQKTNIGIASTIIALPPIFLLPIGHFIFREKITWKAIMGTVLAITGVSLLILL